ARRRRLRADRLQRQRGARARAAPVRRVRELRQRDGGNHGGADTVRDRVPGKCAAGGAVPAAGGRGVRRELEPGGAGEPARGDHPAAVGLSVPAARHGTRRGPPPRRYDWRFSTNSTGSLRPVVRIVPSTTAPAATAIASPVTGPVMRAESAISTCPVASMSPSTVPAIITERARRNPRQTPFAVMATEPERSLSPSTSPLIMKSPVPESCPVTL